MVFGVISCLVCFFFFVLLYQRHMRKEAGAQIANHARVISSSLWTFETASPMAYLTLAAQVNRYQEVVVQDEHGRTFLKINGPQPTGLEALLRSIHLIRIYPLEHDILYEGRSIGHISAKWPCHSIYLYFYIMFCILLLLVGFGLLLKLIDSKHFLESRVRQRTTELEREVGERQRAEAGLRAHSQRLSLHVLNTPLGVIEWDTDFKAVEWNKSAERIFGYTRDEALGRTALDLIIPEEEIQNVQHIWGQLLTQSGGTRSINANRTSSGKIRTCEWYNTIMTHPDGSVMGIASLVLDITERVEAEQEKQHLEAQLLQAQKMEAVGNLAGGIAHDFNNLLQGISGYTQLMLIDCAKRGADISRLRGIEKASQRAADLIRQLLTFSRKIESDLRPINLNFEIQQMQEMLGRTLPKMIAIEPAFDSQISDINGDPIQIEQILLNLAINAMHAMPEGGRLRIETRNVVLDEDFCRHHLGARQGPYVLLTVADTGAGMDQVTLARIFEPFYTTKAIGHGSGLGLSMVYGIVKSHQGYIECHSAPGKGSVFRIYFPSKDFEPVASRQAPIAEHCPTGTETLLFIDDDAAIRDIATAMLTQHGYTALAAASGEEGLELYRVRKSGIDLVVLDLNMPGMGGFKCMQALKDLDPDIRILIISGYNPKGILRQRLEEDCRGFIPKPFRMSDLLMRVRQALDDAQPETGGHRPDE
jgi:two-component system cell cycle sensor histidine kinase/response regulator CckA